MENENKKQLLKVFRKNKYMRNIALVTLLVCIFCFALGTIIKSRKISSDVNIEDVTDTQVYANSKIYAITDCFATYSVDSSVTDEYYLALGENYLFVLNLSKSQYNDISKQWEEDEELEFVELKGVTENMPSDLKQLAIDTYNEIYETEDLNSYNFNEAFVPYVLNAKKTPNDSYQIFYGIGAMAAMATNILLICFIINLISTRFSVNKIAKKYDLTQIALELSSGNNAEFNKTKVLFMDNYLVSYCAPYDVIKYKDIAWIYLHDNYVNGVKSTMSIMMMTKDGRLHTIAQVSASGKANNEQYTNTFNELVGRRPEALVGYTNENVTAMSKKNREETIAKLNEKDNEI